MNLLRDPTAQGECHPDFLPVKAALQRLLLALWKDLVEDPETIKQVIHLLAVAIADPAVKAAALLCNKAGSKIAKAAGAAVAGKLHEHVTEQLCNFHCQARWHQVVCVRDAAQQFRFPQPR